VGQRGTRVQTVITELGGEKIDIVEWSEEPEKFITSALSPAKVESVKVNEKEKTAVVKVKEDQLSLAIGRDGQNVRLAAKLTDWKIDIEGAEKVLEKTSEDKSDEPKPEEKEDKKKSKAKKEPSSVEATDDKEDKEKSKKKDKKEEAKEEVEEEVTTDEKPKEKKSKKQESEK